MKQGKDPYDALGVSRDASADEIKKAYRRLAREYHPDASGGDKAKETRFKEITAAYEVLGDAEKRARYDAWRAGPTPGMGGAAGFPEGLDLGDLFAQVFAGAAGSSSRQGGAPGGFVFEVGNFGSPFDSAPRRGRRRRTTPAQPRTSAPAERKVRASDGTLLTQRGADVYSNVRLQFDQAVLGSVSEVPTLSGKAKLKIPPGTSSGVKLRLKGKGARKQDGTRGDHIVTVQIDVPKKIDEESERLLAQLMQRLRKDH